MPRGFAVTATPVRRCASAGYSDCTLISSRRNWCLLSVDGVCNECRDGTCAVCVPGCAGEKPFKCELCDYCSYKKSCVKKHSMTHSEDKPYQCQYCDHKARFKPDLEKHERTHTGERPFECEFCEYRAAVKSSVTQHIIRAHKDMVP